jgi:RNA polymerase sigma factor (sigma-70 family)
MLSLAPHHAISAVMSQPVSPNLCDADLAQRAARGDLAAFELIYRSHYRRVFNVICRIVGGVEARAEELAQETFLRAWQAMSTFRAEAALSTWLHRLAVNAALMDLRGRREAEDREVDDAVLDQKAGHCCTGDLRVDLQVAINGLPPRARAVLVLFDLEGWTHEEISEALHMAVGSSKAQLHRARSLLRQRWEAA